MLSQITLDRVTQHWSQRLGCGAEPLHDDRLCVIVHGPGLRGWNGAYGLRNAAGGVIVSVPHGDLQRTARALNDHTPQAAFRTERLAAAFAERVERTVGPASLAYLDDATFTRVPASGVRELDDDDADAFASLRAGCDATEWDHGDVELGRNPVYGAFTNGRIVAVASWDMRGGVANVGVIAHPEYRSRGLARGVASAASANLLARGELPQWQTLIENAPALAVGRALGYVELYQSIAIRLR